jgi:multidrug efflux pump subunit AcrB
MMATELVDPFAPTIAASAIVSLVFALLGLSLLPVLGQLVSIIAGHHALSRIKRSDGAVQGRGLALAGLWVSYIALALGALALCAFAGGLFELQRSLTQP